jgi:hypothetical protein
VGQEEAAVASKTIEDAQKALSDSLMSRPGVAGIGIGECDGEPCIRVFVVAKTEDLMRQIPETFEGFRVKVDETGEFQARDST